MRVTKDDYYNKFGVNLDLEFRGGNYDNETQAVDIWLNNNEESFIDYLSYIYKVTSESECWNEEEIKRALLEQDKHIMNYGDIPAEGMRDEENKFVPFLAPKARMILTNIGVIINFSSFSRYGDYYG